MRSRLILLGLLVFVAGLVALFPARVALRFAPPELAIAGVSGTLWSGKAEAVSLQGFVIGPVKWQLEPLALMTGAAAAEIEAGLPGGFFAGHVWARGERVVVEDARASIQLESVTARSSIGPSQGTANLILRRLVLEALWPAEADADLTVSELSYSAVGPYPLGAYRIVFDPSLAESEFPVVARIESLSGPFTLSDARLRLAPGQRYSMSANVAASDGADDAMRNALRFAPRNADGTHLLAFDGNL